MPTPFHTRDAVVSLLVFTTCWVFASGCRPSSKKDSGQGTSAAPVEIDVGQLPPLDDDMPPQEGGALLLAPPEGWNIASKTKSRSIRFYDPSGRQGYPLILIDWDETTLAEKLTEENVRELAESFAQSEGTEIFSVIGDNNVALLWKENQGTDPKRPGALVERMVAVVIAQGQLYRLEYRNWQDELANEKHSDRELLLAVVEGIRFPLEPQPEEPVDETSDSDVEDSGTEEPNTAPLAEDEEPEETPGEDEEDDNDSSDLDRLLESLGRP
jgi:hypothetical protein